MPLSEFQKKVLALLKTHRHPDSFVAGGIAINRSNKSARYSNDVDFFHDADEAVSISSSLDIETLKKNSFNVVVQLAQQSFVRAIIDKNGDTLKLEWVRDTAFRFFPVIEDPILGYRLSDIDLTINKCLALANRSEVRDIIDLLELSKNTLSLGAACWAACGKDPGFTPPLIFDCMRRNSIIRSAQVSAEQLVQNVDPVELKQTWMKLLGQAEKQIEEFPAQDLGCLYLNDKGDPIKKPNRKSIAQAVRHFGTFKGSWPKVVEAL